jgi:hypothetical protein
LGVGFVLLKFLSGARAGRNSGIDSTLSLARVFRGTHFDNRYAVGEFLIGIRCMCISVSMRRKKKTEVNQKSKETREKG